MTEEKQWKTGSQSRQTSTIWRAVRKYIYNKLTLVILVLLIIFYVNKLGFISNILGTILIAATIALCTSIYTVNLIAKSSFWSTRSLKLRSVFIDAILVNIISFLVSVSSVLVFVYLGRFINKFHSISNYSENYGEAIYLTVTVIIIFIANYLISLKALIGNGRLK